MEQLDVPTQSRTSDAATRAQKVRQVLQELWEANRGTIAERTAIIRIAYDQAMAGTLAPDARENAVSAAHKLAGVLGTFGFPRGSELALQAQHLLEAPGPVPAGEVEHLKNLLDELSIIVTTKSLPPS